MSGFSDKDGVQGAAEAIAKTKISEGATSSASAEGTAAATDPSSMKSVAELQAYIRKAALEKAQKDYQKKMEKKMGKDEHKFWDTQPMAKKGEVIPEVVNEAVDKNTDISKVRQTPYGMPAGFEWCELDVHDETTLNEIYVLLRDNYVEDDEAMFRFDYSKEFLIWALTVPGFRKEWHVGVRLPSKEEGKPGKLMATITAVPALVQVHGVESPMVEINFLCVHKKLREKRLSPMLIREITRRVNLTGRWQAVYTAGAMLPGCKAECRYWHRSLQFEKLVDVRFSYLPFGKTMKDHVAYLDLPKKPAHALRAMVAADVPQVTALINNYLRTLKMSQIFGEEEVHHLLLPQPNVVNSYVLENDDKVITDFASFYFLSSSILKHPKFNKLVAVYSYYNVAATMSHAELMTDLLILAKGEGADVFNALDVMANASIFEDLKFGRGDGSLQYYVYNWNCAKIDSSGVGLVLV